jgi:hypothetical protein
MLETQGSTPLFHFVFATLGRRAASKQARVIMKIIAIDVGLPREIFHEGRLVRTGIFKAPVAGPVRVNALNIAGDQQADLTVHGGLAAEFRAELATGQARLGDGRDRRGGGDPISQPRSEQRDRCRDYSPLCL